MHYLLEGFSLKDSMTPRILFGNTPTDEQVAALAEAVTAKLGSDCLTIERDTCHDKYRVMVYTSGVYRTSQKARDGLAKELKKILRELGHTEL